jgi:hypothetical protein
MYAKEDCWRNRVGFRFPVALFMSVVILTARPPVANGQPPPPRDPSDEALDPLPEPPPGPDRPGPEAHPRPEAPPPGLWLRMREAERKRVMAFVKDRLPLIYNELERIQERSPERFERRMGRLAPEMLHLMELLEVDPERARLMIKERVLDLRIRRQVQRLRKTRDEGERDEIEKALRNLTEQAFENRLQRRELEIRDLQARIEELQDRLEEAREDREELIERELQNILKGKGKHRFGKRRHRPGGDREDGPLPPPGPRPHRQD